MDLHWPTALFKEIQIQILAGSFRNSEEQALVNSRRKSQKTLLGMTPWDLDLMKGHISHRIGLHWYVQHEVPIQKQMEQLIGIILRRVGLTGDRLLRAAEEALIPGSTAHVEIVNTIREDHIDSARKLIREIDFECKRLEDFLNAAQVCLVNMYSDQRLSTKSAPRQKISL